MALTFNRWLASAVVACAAIAYAGHSRSASAQRFDPTTTWYWSGGAASQSTSRARLDLALAIVRARTLARRDSIVPLLRGTSSEPDLRFGAGVPPMVRSRMQKAIAREWALVGASPTSDVRVAILAVLDTAPLPHGVARIGSQRVADQTIFLPSATDQRTCLVIFALGPFSADGFHPALNEALDHVLGPCLFYAAFGHPGPAIDRWLRGRHYDLAYNAAWSGPSIALHRSLSPLRDDAFDGGGQTLGAVACMGGNRERCTAIVADTTTRTQSLAVFSARSAPDVIKPSDLWATDLLLNGQWFLSDVVHEHGREKFARFWTSTQPMTTAFQSAMGESLGDWVYTWTTARYGAVHIGPSPRWLGAAELLTLAIAAALTTVWLSSRRQVR